MKPFRTSLILSLFFITATGMAVLAPSPETLNAQALPPFGGKITTVFYCSCSQNLLLTVSPPVPGAFVYQPGITQLFSYGQVYRPGAWILGNFTTSPACFVPAVPTGCAPLPAEGIIGMAGTSL